MADGEREEALVRSDALDRVTDGVVALDADLQCTYVNARAERILGRTADQLVGERVRDAFPDDAGPAAREAVEAAVSSGESRSFEHHDTDLGRWFEVRVYPDGNGVTLLFTDVTGRKSFEERLRVLQGVAVDLNAAQSVGEVAELAVDAAATMLDLPMAALWLYDDEREALVPVAESESARESIGPAPTFEAGQGLAWDVFEDGEYAAYEDVSTRANAYEEDTAVASEILVPLGDHGLMSTSSTAVGAFDEADIELFRILAAETEATLVRAKRERELRRKNERLDEFASVISHEIRGPLDIALGRVSYLAEQRDSDHLDEAVAALDRMESIVEDTLTLARQGDTVAATEPIAVADLVEECWKMVETTDATLTVVDEFTVRADHGRLRHVFENLFRNAVEHGGDDVAVRVGLADDDTFYVEDDGPGIPETDREAVFEPGESSTSGGTGLGLTIVRRVAEAHGWTVAVTGSADGGARFEFSGVDRETG